MRIVDRHELMKQPPGVIYSEFEPMICSDLYCKGDTCVSSGGKNIDWLYVPLVPSCWNGDPPTLDDNTVRDGSFDEKMRYVLLEEAELRVLQRLVAASGPAIRGASF